MADGVELRWDPPGPGRWELETSHGARTVTPFFRDIWAATERAGFKWASARFGAPVSHPELRHVNGWAYMRVMPLLEPRPGATPPKPVIWALVRLVPELRRREKQAERIFGERLWLEDVERWEREEKPGFIAANLELQDEPVGSYDDVALAAHLRRAVAHAEAGSELHFRLHGTDIFVPGDFLAHCAEWGLDARRAVELLQGSSPASAETTAQLRVIAAALDDAGKTPQSLDDVHQASPAAAAALDQYLRLHGWRLVSSYDVAGLTLHELPNLVLTSILHPPLERPSRLAQLESELRAEVPPQHRASFDRLLADARHTYGVRDDNVGVTYMWPVGLVRRALLEAGRRLEDRGRIQATEHLFEAKPEEVVAIVRGAATPTADELAAAAGFRRRCDEAVPPTVLGPEEGEPPLDVLPPGLRRSGLAALTYSSLLFQEQGERQRLKGSGIGTETFTGRARVAVDAADALARLEPGDVLVTAFTTPAYNAVLPVVGALVVEEGGALSHAAIVAREFGIPAVIGAHQARSAIGDGSLVEVDPLAGEVRVVSPADRTG